MRILVQRVTRASVRVGDSLVGQIGPGLLLFVGVTGSDTEREARTLSDKVANLRIFDDAAGTMNLSALDMLGSDSAAIEMLVVSQFTLYADTRKGRRPSFINAAAPAIAAPLVQQVVDFLRSQGFRVETGRFGAEMAVELVNDGPVTIWLDTAELPTGRRA